MLILSREDMDQVFTMKDAIEACKTAFACQSSNRAEAPVRQKLTADDDQGVFLFMPGHINGEQATGIKIVTVFPGNAAKGKSSVLATMLLFDDTTGEAVCMMDGTYLTQLRTGAASGAAIELLAREDVSKGALFGTGGQAEKQLEAMMTARRFDEIMIYSRDFTKCKAFTAAMIDRFEDSFDVRLIAAQSMESAVNGADVITVATSSMTPVFDGNLVKPGAHINGVGSYTLDMIEMDAVTLKRSGKLYVDAYEAYLAEAGEIVAAIKNGDIDVLKVTGELGELILGEKAGRQSEDEITIFKSVGISPQDIVTATQIYQKALAAGIGTVVAM